MEVEISPQALREWQEAGFRDRQHGMGHMSNDPYTAEVWEEAPQAKRDRYNAGYNNRAAVAPEPGSMEDLFGEVISRYTRADAIADGQLVEVDSFEEASIFEPGIALEAGYVNPVAMTASVAADIRDIPPSKSWQDEKGRLWDMLWVGRVYLKGLFETAARQGSAETLYHFHMDVGRKKLYTVKLHLGLGDQGEPVLTFLRPEED